MKKVLLATLVLTGGWFLGTSAMHMQAASSGQATASSAGKDNEASVDQDISLLRQDLRSKRKQLIASTLKLTDTEATKFWPIYDQYAAESSKLGDQKYALLKEYAQGFGTLTNEQALSLIGRSLEVDEQIGQLRSKYVPIVNQVLPGTKTATFFQLDRRISELIDLQLATGIPLVQEQN
jgi:hypothetical protein